MRRSKARRSAAEIALYEAVRVRWPDAVPGACELLRNSRLSLDVYIPSTRAAIEFDGTYWHSEARRPSWRDRDKANQCKAAGILLYRVREQDWTADREATLAAVFAFLEDALRRRGGLQLCLY